MPTTTDIRDHERLEDTAILVLEFAWLLMESGASARHVEEVATRVAFGLGIHSIDLRVSYDSVGITLAMGSEKITRIRKVGVMGANQSLHYALGALASRIEQGELNTTQGKRELDRLVQDSQRHPDLVVAVAVGIACAAFGRLLNVDWRAIVPIFVAAALAQIARRLLALRRVNFFISATLVAFLASVLSGIGARWAGSQTLDRDMVAPVLLLVPGVPCFNALFDILEGRPALGTARSVWVTVTLIFMTAGVWLAQGILGEGR